MNASIGCSSCALLQGVVEGTCSCRLRGLDPHGHAPHPCCVVYFKLAAGSPDLSALWTCGFCDFEIGLASGATRSSLDEEETKVLIRAGMGHLEKRSLGESAVKRYRFWLDRCVSAHQTCSRLGLGALPIRLLRLIRRRESYEVSLDCTPHYTSQYAALSYCWGGRKPPVTLRTNFEKHQNGVSFSELPLTYKDAVRLVYAIGLQYLWIDSLHHSR